MTNEEWRAIENSIMILTTNTSRLTVVVNNNDYYEKCNGLFEVEKSYQKLKI